MKINVSTTLSYFFLESNDITKKIKLFSRLALCALNVNRKKEDLTGLVNKSQYRGLVSEPGSSVYFDFIGLDTVIVCIAPHSGLFV